MISRDDGRNCSLTITLPMPGTSKVWFGSPVSVRDWPLIDSVPTSDAPVRTPFGYHVIQVDDVRPVKFPPLADVKQQIQRRIAENKIEEMVRGLRAKAKVE